LNKLFGGKENKVGVYLEVLRFGSF